MPEYQFAVIVSVEANSFDDASKAFTRLNFVPVADGAALVDSGILTRVVAEGEFETDNDGQRVLYLPPLPGDETVSEEDVRARGHTD